jgi:hypothetical protein
MLDFDVNEGFIDRRTDCVAVLVHADAPTPGRHVRLAPCPGPRPGPPS